MIAAESAHAIQDAQTKNTAQTDEVTEPEPNGIRWIKVHMRHT